MLNTRNLFIYSADDVRRIPFESEDDLYAIRNFGIGLVPMSISNLDCILESVPQDFVYFPKARFVHNKKLSAVQQRIANELGSYVLVKDEGVISASSDFSLPDNVSPLTQQFIGEMELEKEHHSPNAGSFSSYVFSTMQRISLIVDEGLSASDVMSVLPSDFTSRFGKDFLSYMCSFLAKDKQFEDFNGVNNPRLVSYSNYPEYKPSELLEGLIGNNGSFVESAILATMMLEESSTLLYVTEASHVGSFNSVIQQSEGRLSCKEIYDVSSNGGFSGWKPMAFINHIDDRVSIRSLNDDYIVAVDKRSNMSHEKEAKVLQLSHSNYKKIEGLGDQCFEELLKERIHPNYQDFFQIEIPAIEPGDTSVDSELIIPEFMFQDLGFERIEDLRHGARPTPEEVKLLSLAEILK